jgi:hypothetical protein
MMYTKPSRVESHSELESLRSYFDNLEHFFEFLNLPEKSEGIRQLSETLSSAFVNLAIIGQFKSRG